VHSAVVQVARAAAKLTRAVAFGGPHGQAYKVLSDPEKRRRWMNNENPDFTPLPSDTTTLTDRVRGRPRRHVLAVHCRLLSCLG
jgi:hypothetical protein